MSGNIYRRFNVDIDLKETQRRFINRAYNDIFDKFLSEAVTEDSEVVLRHVMNELGERYEQLPEPVDYQLEELVNGDFFTCLEVLEAIYSAFTWPKNDDLSSAITYIVDRSENDLGITWKSPYFIPTGANLLDETLVNGPLEWLSESRYQAIYDPFSKGLSHFLESSKKPELLPDVITDMYEALEATAKLVVGNDKDLSTNRQRFVDRLPVSEKYKSLLKEYIVYANDYRHGANENQPRPEPSRAEVESFVYLTGLFIRLAVESTSNAE